MANETGGGAASLPTFSPGDTVYGITGDEGRYVAAFREQHLVEPVYDHDDDTGEPLFGDPVVWSQVFAEAPRARVDKTLAELYSTVEKVKAEVIELRREKQQLEADRKGQSARMAKHKALDRINDYLDGKFEFFLVVPEYGAASILSRAEALKADDRYSRDQKLLSLFGRSGGDLQWRINKHYDGSGHWADVYPVQTEAEGLALAQGMLDRAVAGWRAVGDSTGVPGWQWLESAVALGLVVPADLAEHKRKTTLAGCERRLKELTDAADKVKVEMAKVEAGA